MSLKVPLGHHPESNPRKTGLSGKLLLQIEKGFDNPRIKVHT